MDRDLAGRLDAVIDAALAAKRIVGTTVLAARAGTLVYGRAAGLADREAGMAMPPQAIFRLASLTKPMVSAAAMRLVEEGRIGLDDPVTRWLPGFRPALADGTRPVITVRHLLTHSAGLSYGFLEPAGSAYHRLGISDGLDQPGLSMAENLSRLARAPLAFAPGSAWRYSLSIDVLGALLAEAAGVALPDLVSRLVTAPLGMADTGFAVSETARLVTPYVDGVPEPTRITDGLAVPVIEGILRFAPSRIFDPRSFASGGGGMAGTAEDFLLFIEAIRTGGAPILEPATIEQMTALQIGPRAETRGPGWGFGFGWAVLADPAAAGTPQSEGTLQWGGAYGHSWFVDPARSLSVVALTNTAFEGMGGAFPTAVRNAVYG